MNTVIAFILMFGLLVFVHEFGHFIVAKKTGMLVREFAIGFGPKIFSIKKNETLYTIRILPMGGYVRVAGEDPEIIELKPGQHIGLLFNKDRDVSDIIIDHKEKYPLAEVIEVRQADLTHDLFIEGSIVGEEETTRYTVSETADYVMNETKTQIAPYHRQFGSKSKTKRALQLFAGPFMNFVLTAVLFFFLAGLQGIPVEEAQVGDVLPDTPASEAGLIEGDVITNIDNQTINTWMEFQTYVASRPNESLSLIIERHNDSIALEMVPEAYQVDDQTVGRIGVMRGVERSWLKAIPYSLNETFYWSKMIITNVAMLISGQFTVDALSGPVGIYDFTDQVVQSGFYSFLTWTAALSVNLGIINLLPLPALDGGRLLFIGIEAVRGKPISQEKEGLVHFIGFALLMLLMIIVTWNDLQRLFF
ncbi:zinc metalloprotease [Halolactibacillus miurensis]|uniref:Zinc metalloprotease n=1 Tax=Halolactibacillus miurensis TaxID=306541 RepID=A0A1I6QFD7_9BACI|nr:RIP metalloprotease RseP [Halolactibacillus miurensis]GEM03401.1 zinc metalloprotease [Halolactibacillus miurensis]SFS51187.1 regulator of sigma E protease [Halolactibacillus miurensis]